MTLVMLVADGARPETLFGAIDVALCIIVIGGQTFGIGLKLIQQTSHLGAGKLGVSQSLQRR